MGDLLQRLRHILFIFAISCSDKNRCVALTDLSHTSSSRSISSGVLSVASTIFMAAPYGLHSGRTGSRRSGLPLPADLTHFRRRRYFPQRTSCPLPLFYNSRIRFRSFRITDGATESSSTPIFMNASVSSGSAPSSPQIPARFPALCALSTVIRIIFKTAR